VLVDADKLHTGDELRADVVVIGAGAAGISLARALGSAGRDVLLLESGDFTFDAATQSLYKGRAVGLPIDPVEHFGLDVPRLRFFGGTTNHWAGFCRPFPALDFETRDWVPRSGWPISRESLDPYYARALDVLQLGPLEFGTDYWNAQGLMPRPLLEADDTPHVVYQLTSSPQLGVVYRDELVGSDRVKVVTHANVMQLVLADGGDDLTHVDCSTLGGTTFRATGRAYVLATGGLETPRILLTSDRQRHAGIGNEYDLVGRHFMEHVNIAVGVALLTTDQSELQSYIPHEHTLDVSGTSRKLSLQSVLLLSEQLQRSEQLRACEVTLEYPFTPDDPRLGKIFPGVGRGLSLVRAEGMDPKTAIVLRVLCEQEPNPASRVTLVRDKDRLGMRRIQLDWRLTDADRLSMVTTLQHVTTEIARRGLGRARFDIKGYQDLFPAAGDSLDFEVNTGSHHIGTARMAASPRDGVVDPDAKVHSVANLYLAGSSVFPTNGANTPTFTIIALALRLADHLHAQLG
jgi:choline dehydrogenase-like flavoprotein